MSSAPTSEPGYANEPAWENMTGEERWQHVRRLEDRVERLTVEVDYWIESAKEWRGKYEAQGS